MSGVGWGETTPMTEWLQKRSGDTINKLKEIKGGASEMLQLLVAWRE